MRQVLILLALVGLMLGPVAGPGGMVHAGESGSLADCAHAADHHHAAGDLVADADGETGHCPDPLACMDMSDCRHSTCAVAVAPVPASWPAVAQDRDPGVGRDDRAAGIDVPPLMEPPRPTT